MNDVDQMQDRLIWAYFGRRPYGFFIEVGANHPTEGSLTWFLEQRGWEGMLVEPQGSFAKSLVAMRPHSHVFHVACAAPDQVGFADLHIPLDPFGALATLERNFDDHQVQYQRAERVEVVTLSSLIDQVKPKKIEVLLIDTEGTELAVLKGLDMERNRPDLILVEDKGRSLDKHSFLTRHRYDLVKRTELNNWYVPRGAQFRMTGAFERLLLWRKVFLGLPVRKYRHWRRSRRFELRRGARV
jgi:FkbM family methyltransferase